MTPESRRAVCIPADNVIRLYPIYASDEGLRYVIKDGVFVALAGLEYFVREESAIPKYPLYANDKSLLM